jgi:hypothetical protein
MQTFKSKSGNGKEEPAFLGISKLMMKWKEGI